MSKPRILIVEDEYLVAADLEATLDEFGYETVGIAPDLETALALAAAKPDVALVDIHLRDGPTGLKIAQRLANDHEIHVLLVTANPRMALCARGDLIVGVLGKPCADAVVAQAVGYALHSRARAPLPLPPAGLTLIGAGASA